MTGFFREKDQPDGIQLLFNTDMKKLLATEEAKRVVTVPASCLNAHMLLEPLDNTLIIAELGEVAKMSMGYMVQLIKKQATGQPGIPHNNAEANFFYPEEFPGWAVDCYWDSGCGRWDLVASPVADPGGWGAGGLVFSPDSLAA